MTTYVSVQRAAHRLGVSPVTIRRWTATGVLPCTRTAGGHRRISLDDLDEMTRTASSGTHLAARRARERELETLVETSVAVVSRLELADLLAEIAERMTQLLGCQFCSISEYDAATRRVRSLAEYDESGQRLPDYDAYHLREFPLTARVIDEQVSVTVNVDDRHADAAETAVLRRDGDRSLLMLPLVYRGVSIGLIEVTDKLRARRYSRQELRLCEAIAGQAAVALRNAHIFAQSRRSSEDEARLRGSLATIAAAAPALTTTTDARGLLELVAGVAGDAVGAVSCVVGGAGLSAGAAHPDASPDDARIVVVHDPAALTDLAITVALAGAPTAAQTEALHILAAFASALLARIGSEL